ncbi:hypothetical protein ONA70_02235 [Micromonospora yasonensis]|uniref:hypothetical protein n=1 Tax=Micromonospora yasonensis TaxID=1128667 RepID=UPI0022316B2C|nr:hypothetical protein [Micromonospora yasonensis]MCW3838915.1 hypothetical protein [Micromonospora yasonensis]
MTGGAFVPAGVVFALLSLVFGGKPACRRGSTSSPAMDRPDGRRRRFRCCGLRFRPMLAASVRIGRGSGVSAGVLVAVVVRACSQLADG